jgi:glycylpeptide N-tetradecanoyltransferase
MRAEDAPQVLELLNRYLARTDFAPVFTSEEEIKHWLLHREGVIWSYVVENRNGKITDLFSYYAIPSQVINPCKHKAVNVAYQFYYASETAFNEGDEKKLAERLQVLFKDALILARQVRWWRRLTIAQC